MTTSIPEGSVIITPMEVYREMQATHQAVQNVATKLDAALDATGRRLDAVDGPDGRLKDHEVRLRAVERKIWTAAGITSVLSAGAAFAATLLSGSGH